METSRHDSEATVRLEPVVKGAEAAELMEEVKRLLDEGVTRVVVDLARVEHIDSAGLGMMVNAARRIQQAHARLELTGLTPPVRSIFRTSGLLDVLPVADEPPAGGG
jgi:anti-sigma B factor antagonist